MRRRWSATEEPPPAPTYHPGIAPILETERLPRPVLDRFKRRKSEDTFMSMVLRRGDTLIAIAFYEVMT